MVLVIMYHVLSYHILSYHIIPASILVMCVCRCFLFLAFVLLPSVALLPLHGSIVRSFLPDAREDGRELATDNAVSALGNLLEAQRDSLGGVDGVGRAWELWLGYMPLRADEEEAEKVGGWVEVVTGPLLRTGGVFYCFNAVAP